MSAPESPTRASRVVGLVVIAAVTLVVLQLSAAVILLHPWLGVVILGAAMTVAAGWSRRGTVDRPGR